MSKKSKTIAVIPARGGSKGVVGKNLREIKGKSLIERAIASASVKDFIDDIVVSTDSPEIQKAAQKCGLPVEQLRPASLATDKASVIDVLLYCIKEYEERNGSVIKSVVLLEPTSPFRNRSHVLKAMRKFEEGNFGSLVSVCPQVRKPENIQLKVDGGCLEPYIKKPKNIHICRQEMSNICRINSAIYVFDAKRFRISKKLLIPEVGYLEMTEIESINIDSENDLQYAKIINKI